MRRKYKLRLGLLIVGLILCISGITYAYLRQDKIQKEENFISTINCLNVTFENETERINLQNAFAISDEDALQTVVPYKFTIRNNCQNDINAEINFESLLVEKQLNKEFVKIYFKSEEMESPIISIVDALEDREAIIENATSDHIMDIKIKGYKEKDFELKLWVDYDTTAEEGMNKYYEGKVVIRAVPDPLALKVYGVRRNIDTSSSAWERIGGSVNFVANAQFGDTPVRNDFDYIYPWNAIDTYAYNLSTGEEISLTEVGVDNFPFTGKSADGTKEYEILTRIPEFYYNRYQQIESDGKTYEYILISKEPLEGFYKSETFSVGRYTMSGSSSAVHSRSGVQPLTNVTITNFRTYAKKLGSDFGQMDYHYFILQLLYLVEYADYNSQAKLGQGHTTSPTLENGGIPVNSGGTNTLGMKSGTFTNDGKHSVTYRGIEDIFGNVWQWVDGINIKEYVTYICTDQTQYAVDTFTGCYKPVGYTNLIMTQGYPSKLGYDTDNPLVATPIASGGSETTYITDLYWSATGNRSAIVGGSWLHGVRTGLWCWSFHLVSSFMNVDVGSRLLRYN